ncbi:DUF1636 domain-containing protein [Roseobacter sp.]|uniref:DUF1636 domain-containing protein n=1 Tax=Roseobacter sp. TaxID=1907202 RepID=UPI003299D32D
MDDQLPVLSICMTCRDGREDQKGTRGGTRLAHRVSACMANQATPQMHIRGVQCMSQCKRSCIVSLSAHAQFTYIFGDLDPENGGHVDALFDLVSSYRQAAEGFLERKDRPKALQANILGRLPPLDSRSQLISSIEMVES